MIPQQTPVNQNKKTGALQNACPKFISRPQTQSSYKFVSYKWLVWKYVLLVHVQLSPGNPAIFFPKTRFLQNGMVDQKKKPYKMPPFVIKMPLEWDMGQAISKWKYTQG